MKNLLKQRRAGVLLHISSLPSGDMGEDARHFVDFLNATGSSVWQTLPLNMPHGDGSPYQSLSAHAGNPQFISLELLSQEGLLTESGGADKATLIAAAYASFEASTNSKEQAAFASFCHEQAHWLEDFSLFMTLREQFKNASWNTWPDAYKLRDAEALAQVRRDCVGHINLLKFTQYLFFKQWHALKAYANSKKVYLFGDIPIFVSYDSADVWAHPELFKLDEHGNMTVVAGVPPDYFSETGQRWGNPHYNWPVMQQDGFAWWLARMRTQNELFDLVRIDHFRGLEAAWEIPASQDTAINGEWQLAPGSALLKAITKELPEITLVAEDLGIITDEVNALRLKYKLPGMKILQFAFGGGEDNPYLPENIEENSVVYTGTHDNDTTLGWYLSLGDHARQHLHHYLENETPDMPMALVEMALASAGVLAIIPMQDILQLDSTHRMNIPGTIEGNWGWRFEWSQLQPEMRESFAAAIARHHRVHP